MKFLGMFKVLGKICFFKLFLCINKQIISYDMYFLYFRLVIDKLFILLSKLELKKTKFIKYDKSLASIYCRNPPNDWGGGVSNIC